MGFLDALAPFLDTAAQGVNAYDTGTRDRAAAEQESALAAIERRAKDEAARRAARMDNARISLFEQQARKEGLPRVPKREYDETRGVVVDVDDVKMLPIPGLPSRPEAPRALVRGQPGFLEAVEAEAAARARGSAAGQPPSGDRTSAATRVKLAEGAGLLQTIDDALAELDAYPEAIGIKRGLGVVPGLGGLEDLANQNIDPRGIAARAAISNVGSLQMHDRSGAAVSVSEFPRLAPFIPSVRDTPEAARIKLNQLRRHVQTIQNALNGGLTIEQAKASPLDALGAAPPMDGSSVPRGTSPSAGAPPADPGFAAWKASRGGRP